MNMVTNDFFSFNKVQRFVFLCGKPCWHHTPEGLKERIKAEIINLIENEDVTEFLVGELGGYEKDAYATVLDVQKDYPNIRIILVISKITELHEVGECDAHYLQPNRYGNVAVFLSQAFFDSIQSIMHSTRSIYQF